MKQIIWAVALVTCLAVLASAQQTSSQGQDVQRSKSGVGTAKQTPDDLDTFVREYRARKARETTTAASLPACKDLGKLGDAVDRLYESPAMKDILDSVDRQFGTSPVQLSVDDPDSTWNELIDCANQTHSESQRAEALRVAATWEQWRAEHFQNAYRDTLGQLPVAAPACRDLDKLHDQVAAFIPGDQGRASYRLPSGASKLTEPLSECAQESFNLNGQRPEPEYAKAEMDLWAVQHFADIDYENRILTGNGSLIKQYNGLVDDYNRLVDLLKEKSQALNEAYIESLREASLWQSSIPQPATCTGEFHIYGTWGTLSSNCK